MRNLYLFILISDCYLLFINKMEYQRKKKQILSSVQYTNLLSFALVENKLQRNFKSIVQALLLTQSEGSQLKEDLHELAKSSSKQIANLHDKINHLERKWQSNNNNQLLKPSFKKLEGAEESEIHDQNEPQPKVNVNLVDSPGATEQHIPSVKEMANNQAKLVDQYDDLRTKINKLLGDYIDPTQVDKKLANMRDNINLLRAEVKVLSDREAKSSRRVSLGVTDALPIKTNGPASSQDIKDMTLIKDMQEQFEREINNFHIQINTLKLCLEQMKQSQSDIKRKDIKVHVQLDQLLKNHKKLEQRVQNANDTFEVQIKQLKTELFNLQTKSLQQQDANKKSKKSIEVKENVSPNANNQINDKISKLQSIIQGLVSDAQFKRFKGQIKDKIASLQSQDQNIKKELKEQIQMVTQIIDAKEEQIAGIQKQIEQMKSKLNDMSSHCERKNNISISRCDELKKNLQNLREDLEFYKSMNQPSNETKIVIQTAQGNSNEDFKPSRNEEGSGKSAQDLKKYLNRKLHDQRTYLLGLIRDLQKKSGGNNKSNMQQDLVNVWDKLAQLNLFLNKKANEEDMKKSLTYYQKKLANLYQRITSSDQNNQDARIAKTNWFCLSCDKNLQNYQGKVGQHMVWDSMPIKAGYTKYYGKEDKKSLPTLKR